MNREALTQYLTDRIAEHKPRLINQPELKEAAVLLALKPGADPKVVLTRRTKQLSSHSGEVALPGGKRDHNDRDIIATALREAQEEVGLNPDDVSVVGTLDQVVSRYGFLVTPVLAVVPDDMEFVANEAELDAVFEVPLSVFKGQPQRFFERDGFKIPSYDFQGFHIWGLTAMMLAEMLNHIWQADIELVISR